MGNFISRAINYMFPKNELVYSRELQIILPVTQNDIYQENKNDTVGKNNINKDIIWIV